MYVVVYSECLVPPQLKIFHAHIWKKLWGPIVGIVLLFRGFFAKEFSFSLKVRGNCLDEHVALANYRVGNHMQAAASSWGDPEDVSMSAKKCSLD